MSSVGIMLADTVSDEARSVVASAITQIINFIRTLVAYVMEYMKKFYTYMAEHPLAMTLFIANVMVWVS